jgi:ELWxxDGT repeat protein
MTSRRCHLPLAFLIFVASAVQAGAQTASPVIDLAAGPSLAFGSNPEQYTAVRGGRVVFAATVPESGTEVWTSDGTDAGTRMLADLCPGQCSSHPEILGSLAGSSGQAVWVASGNGLPDRIWRTDGTRDGTAPLADGATPLTVFREVAAGDEPDYLPLRRALFGGRLYFQACGGAHGCGLWSTDGTAAGTRLAVPGSKIGGAAIGALAAAGGKLFFVTGTASGTGGSNVPTLWRTDGTAAGTLLLASFPSLPRALTAAGQLFFTAPGRDGNGEELWVSDGSRLGTKPLTHFTLPAPFTPSAQLGPVLVAAGNHVDFAADDGGHGWEIWQSNGTVGGTRRITNFSNPQPFFFFNLASGLAEVNGRVLVQASDGAPGWRLWASTGDPATVAAIHDCLGGCQTDVAGRGLLAVVGGRAIFLAEDAVHGIEPWSTDGTVAGPQFLRDLCPGVCSSQIFGLASLPGGIGFVGFPSDQSPAQLWTSDGTPGGTRSLTHFSGDLSAGDALPLAIGGSSGRIFFSASNLDGIEPWVIENGEPRQIANLAPDAPSSGPRALTPVGGGLVFQATVDGSTRLYRTDGTATTQILAAINPPDTSTCLPLCGPVSVSLGSWAAFLEEPLFRQSGFQLFRTDGTVEGTFPLTNVAPPDRLELNLAAIAGGKVLFFIERHDRRELWRSDGTANGTVLVATVPGTIASFAPAGFASTGSEAWFGLNGDDGSATVWRSNGTAAGTVMAATLPAGVQILGLPFTLAGGRVFFETMETGGTHTVQLWSTNGTAAGTAPVLSGPGIGVLEMIDFAGSLYFLAFDATLTGGLWTSDGTAAGTVRVHSFSLTAEDHLTGVRPHGLTVAGNRLYFAAKGGNEGTELWASDGSTEGTALVKDINPSGSSDPDHLVAVGAGAASRLFFSAFDPVHGVELWQSDGTSTGTHLVQDIAPEDLSSAPDQLTAAGDRLYFTADDGTIGRELWALPLTGAAGCMASATTLCLGNSRYQVEVTWRDPQDHHGNGMAVYLTGPSGDTGAFWFFGADNYEVVVKVLDGTPVNGHVWVFYGALSNVEYTLTVTDTQTGLARRYFNPLGTLASIGDIHAFGPLGAKSKSPAPLIASPSPAPQVTTVMDPRIATVPCEPAPGRLCLHDGRFAVDVHWKDFQGNTGGGTAVTLTNDTGAFWFFNAANLELIVKVLDGTLANGHFWLFYGALSNVEYTLTVTDTQTGTTRTYTNPSGRFASVADTSAF